MSWNNLVDELKFGEGRRLPDRRPEPRSREITFARSDGAEVTYEATIGFYRDGVPGEIFLFGPKDGTDMSAICADGSVLISIALQYGAPPEVLAASIGRVPVELDGPAIKPVSILGAALDAILEAKRESHGA